MGAGATSVHDFKSLIALAILIESPQTKRIKRKKAKEL